MLLTCVFLSRKVCHCFMNLITVCSDNTHNKCTDCVIPRPLVNPSLLLTVLIKDCFIAKSVQGPAQNWSDFEIV